MRRILPLLLAIMGATILNPSSYAAEPNDPSIARWHGNKLAAVSLRFDDSLESHVKYVIPKLNENGMKATFMINPGKDRYKKYKSFWENQVPRMGHDLGNHTMHHKGARTLEEADSEIGEVARLIWRLYPDRSRLMVFASGGGGKKWGGKYWGQADPEYMEFKKKYELIDLYDGKHPGQSADADHDFPEIRTRTLGAIPEGKHLPIVFHGIGTPGLLDRIKTLFRGYELFFPRESFDSLVAFLKQEQERLWIAPLLDVLKYEAERDGATLRILSRDQSGIKLSLATATSPKLYDENLTMVLPGIEVAKVESIIQGNLRMTFYAYGNGAVLADIKPISGLIEVRFR